MGIVDTPLEMVDDWSGIAAAPVVNTPPATVVDPVMELVLGTTPNVVGKGEVGNDPDSLC